MNDDSTFLICDCHSHGLLVEKFKGEEELHISLFERGLSGRTLNWSERLRWIWQIVRYGKPWSDYVILDKEKTNKLVKFINEYEQN